MDSRPSREALAAALNETVGKHGWLHSTPPDPVEEWLVNADAILAALPSEPPSDPERLDVERLYRAMCALDGDDPGIFNIVAISEPDTRPVAELIANYYARLSNDTVPETDPA